MIADTHGRALEIAIKAGIPIAVGADIMVSGREWGANGKELGFW